MDYSKYELLKLLGLTMVEKDEINTYTLGQAIDKVTEDDVLVWEESLKEEKRLYYFYLDESSQALTDNNGNTLLFPIEFIGETFFILDTKNGLFL